MRFDCNVSVFFSQLLSLLAYACDSHYTSESEIGHILLSTSGEVNEISQRRLTNVEKGDASYSKTRNRETSMHITWERKKRERKKKNIEKNLFVARSGREKTPSALSFSFSLFFCRYFYLTRASRQHTNQRTGQEARHDGREKVKREKKCEEKINATSKDATCTWTYLTLEKVEICTIDYDSMDNEWS